MAKQNQITTQTPIRLQPVVYGAFVKRFKDLITEHGASYAVNFALAEFLRSQGMSVADLDTPKDRIAKGQKRRWKAVKQAEKANEQQAEAQREKRRARDQARRAKKKAENLDTA